MAQATSHAPATARPPRVCTLVPFIIICCNLLDLMQAAEENNYEKALSHHRKAQYLNVGGFIFIVVSGVIFLTVYCCCGNRNCTG